MGKITDFLRNIGLLKVSKGDYQTGDIDDRSDLKEKSEMSQAETSSEEEKKATEE